MALKLDEYDKKAKLAPTFVSIIPILVLSHFYLYSKIKTFIVLMVTVEVFGQLTSSAILMFLLMEICRFIGLQYENIYFKGGLYMPTTNCLMYSTSKYSKEYINRIRDKIKADFKLDIPDETQQSQNELTARKGIKEAVGLIRKKVKKGYLTHNKNIQYGLARNLIGAASLGLVFWIINIVLFYITSTKEALIISVILSPIYLLIILFSRPLMGSFGNKYADTLFEEYLSPNIV